MARTTDEIKQELGNVYLRLAGELYGLSSADIANGFDANFSKVSVESLLFYSTAFVINIFERLLDTFREDIQRVVDGGFVANKAWWHAQALHFQKGDELVMDGTTFSYSYREVRPEARIIKKVAVRESVQQDGVCKVRLYVAGESAGEVIPLSPEDRLLFEYYANMIKPSGVLLEVISGAGDVVGFTIVIYYNPLLMKGSGELLNNGRKPVVETLSDFVKNLNNENFGGLLSVTKLVDALEGTTGVVDVRFVDFRINGNSQGSSVMTYESANGWFAVGDDLHITYQPLTGL
jgi:hypothetical protein